MTTQEKQMIASLSEKGLGYMRDFASAFSVIFLSYLPKITTDGGKRSLPFFSLQRILGAL